MADNGEVEAPRDAAELIAGAGEAGGERQRLRRQSGAIGRRGEAVDGGLGRGFVVGLLALDDFGRDITGARHRNDRIEDKRDAGQVRRKGRSDGHRIIAGGIAVFADAEIDDDILDHGGVSPG